MSSSAAVEKGSRPPRRTLLIVGGAEDKLGRSVVLRRFVRLAGGRSSRIVVIPTASAYSREASDLYRSTFTRLRAGADIEIVHASSRAAAQEPQLVASLDRATGIFMTGGSQLKLSQHICGTPVGEAIHRAYRRGVVVAGTSAGASIMSQFMISLGDEGVTPRQRSSQLTAGLGLIGGIVVDQHFDQRGRYGRLMSILANSPQLIGIGIDENTAAEILDERIMSVVGTGAIFVADVRHAVTDAPEARRGAPLLVSGAVVHTLPAGAAFDLQSVSLVRFVEQHPDIEVAVVAAKDRSRLAARTAAARPPA
ncbi:MAG: cyanophycinase [Candidatus Phosphoribacter sp.]|nr:cyanophycinase [Actinomycetales bacterium]